MVCTVLYVPGRSTYKEEEEEEEHVVHTALPDWIVSASEALSLHTSTHGGSWRPESAREGTAGLHTPSG